MEPHVRNSQFLKSKIPFEWDSSIAAIETDCLPGSCGRCNATDISGGG